MNQKTLETRFGSRDLETGRTLRPAWPLHKRDAQVEMHHHRGGEGMGPASQESSKSPARPRSWRCPSPAEGSEETEEEQQNGGGYSYQPLDQAPEPAEAERAPAGMEKM
ncbi:hypothetical protein PAL_GLEAN10017770 [Pteropus alecto]|uniref:Uncharacterized protein n=1 Tax=Pteropus alecto TaxID=9402 RepID=L5KZL1_PTEAL|nr:hypothetical protein PAL_GLEAN10017770 [Pteropus alecto]